MNHNKKRVLETILRLIKSEEKVSISLIENIVSSDVNLKQRQQFVDLVNALKSKSINIEINESKSIIELSCSKINAFLNIVSDKNQKITRIEIVPVIPVIHNLEDLYHCLLNFQSSVYVSVNLDKEQIFSNCSHSKMAISSLIKLVVSAVTLEAVEEGILRLSDRYKIREVDISYLSAGISKHHIGSELTVRELITYLLLASDNTAMDILLRMIDLQTFKLLAKKINPQFHMSIMSTKELMRDAWCHPALTEEQWRQRSLNNVRWTDGYDYLLEPREILPFVKKMMTYAWTPYKEISKNLYKGGSAPGVLSGIWASSNQLFCFILNRKFSFNLVEELYCYRLILCFLEENNFKEEL